MTSRCHWFNPENDTALASGLARYTPPAAAGAMRDAGAALPLWYGEADDYVMITGLDAAWYARMSGLFGFAMRVWPGGGEAVAMPWGWSAYTAHVMRMRGLTDLPSEDKLKRMRDLSGRATCAAVVARLRQSVPSVGVPAMVCRSPEELRRAVRGPSMIKQAWSSSGRGLVSANTATLAAVEKRLCNMMARDGYVTVEPLYRRSSDFAMLFNKNGQDVDYYGISVFATDCRGAYTGNILAPQDVLEDKIRTLSADFDAVRTALPPILAEELADYEGLFGIDMMTVADTGTIAVAEINMRRTMGHFAADLYRKHIHPGVRGLFRVVQTRPDDSFNAIGARITRGTVNLTPPGGKFSFIVEL